MSKHNLLFALFAVVVMYCIHRQSKPKPTQQLSEDFIPFEEMLEEFKREERLQGIPERYITNPRDWSNI